MILNWRDQKVFIHGWEPNAPDYCELCHCPGDLRPYGPRGAWICKECGESEPDRTRAFYAEVMKSVDFCVNPPEGSSRWTAEQMAELLDEVFIAKGEPT
jgi:hypothetical protein